MALRLNPLSTAKGKKFTCEMCGKPATLACQHCRVTYYCAREHQSVDWFGIHEKICQLLGALRTLRPTLGSEDERQRRNLTVQMSQHALIDLCKNEAQKHLVMGQYELAIPGALQSLRFSMEVYGSGRIELVPAYLLLAESNLGLKRYKVAEEFLLYANWSVLKNPDCSNELKSQLYRNFGKLYASQGRFADALKQLALDVYYSSLESGPEHIDTAGGYFYMADVFLTQGIIENALALYDKVVDVWYKFLINLRHRPDESISDYLSESHCGEAVEMLRSILETRKKHLGSNHIATGEAAYALGILKHVTGFDLDARNHYTQALMIYTNQLGGDNESTIAIQRAIDDLPPIPQQLLAKQKAGLEAQRLLLENQKEQARQQAILEEHSMVTHGHSHQPLPKADPTNPSAQNVSSSQQQPQSSHDGQHQRHQQDPSQSNPDQPPDDTLSQPPSQLNEQLQHHLDALKQEQEGTTAQEAGEEDGGEPEPEPAFGQEDGESENGGIVPNEDVNEIGDEDGAPVPQTHEELDESQLDQTAQEEEGQEEQEPEQTEEEEQEQESTDLKNDEAPDPEEADLGDDSIKADPTLS